MLWFWLMACGGNVRGVCIHEEVEGVFVCSDLYSQAGCRRQDGEFERGTRGIEDPDACDPLGVGTRCVSAPITCPAEGLTYLCHEGLPDQGWTTWTADEQACDTYLTRVFPQ
jgi:hypothetical protein